MDLAATATKGFSVQPSRTVAAAFGPPSGGHGGVSVWKGSRAVYYTSGANDTELLAITDSKVVRFGLGNEGD